MKRALKIHPEDNVAVVTEAIVPGDEVYYETAEGRESLTAQTAVPIYHKISLTVIPKGARVYKYGCVIGDALEDIPKGVFVHVHNLDSEKDGGIEA